MPHWGWPIISIGIYLGDEREQLRKSRQHVERAIELDPTYGRAHNSLGFINTVEGDFAAAMQSYDLARLYYDKYHWGYAILLFALGRYDEAVVHYAEAAGLDPLSTAVREQLMISRQCAGQYRRLVDEAQEQLQLEPDSIFARVMLADAYIELGDTENALRYAEEVAASERNDLSMAYVFAKAGQTDRARAALDAGDVVNEWLRAASAAAALGDAHLATDILESAIDRVGPEIGDFTWSFGHIRCVPTLMSLEGNPRFDALVARMDLPD